VDPWHARHVLTSPKHRPWARVLLMSWIAGALYFEIPRRLVPFAPLFVCVALLADVRAGDTPDELPWHDALLRITSADYRQAQATREQLKAELAGLPDAPHNQQSAKLGYQIHRGGRDQSATPVWIEVMLPMEVEVDAVVLVPIDAPSRDFSGPGYGFPQRFRVEVIGDTAVHTVAEHTAEALPNPGRMPVWISTRGVRGNRVRVTMTEPWTRLKPYAVYARQVERTARKSPGLGSARISHR